MGSLLVGGRRANGVLVFVGLLSLIGLAAVVGRPLGVSRVIHYSASYPALTVGDLVAAADLVAVIEPQGAPMVHWNSRDGAEWTNADEKTPAYIYSDERMKIVNVVIGSLRESSLVLRTPGGSVGPVSMAFDSAPSWKTGGRYLAFLELAQTPSQTGIEPFWSTLWMDRGIFDRDGLGTWRNERAGLVVNDLETLRKQP